MKSAWFLLSLGLLFGLCSCSPAGVTKTDTGIVIDINSDFKVKKLILTVVNERQISVLASTYPEVKTDGTWGPNNAAGTPFKVVLNDSIAGVNTLAAGVKANKKTALLIFTDSVGNKLISLEPEFPVKNESDSLTATLVFSQTNPFDTIPSPSPDGYKVYRKTIEPGKLTEYVMVYGESTPEFK